MRTEAPKKKRFSGQLFLKSLYQKEKNGKGEWEWHQSYKLCVVRLVIPICKQEAKQKGRISSLVVFFLINIKIYVHFNTELVPRIP